MGPEICTLNSYTTEKIFSKTKVNIGFSEKATKIVLTVLSKRQNKWICFFQIFWPSHNILTLIDF